MSQVISALLAICLHAGSCLGLYITRRYVSEAKTLQILCCFVQSRVSHIPSASMLLLLSAGTNAKRNKQCLVFRM
jgi:hypothetical protein